MENNMIDSQLFYILFLVNQMSKFVQISIHTNTKIVFFFHLDNQGIIEAFDPENPEQCSYINAIVNWITLIRAPQ